ncbi:MAG: pyridoxamine 5'-phosphate oxidase family protein [Myxococcota bacterium]
MTSHETRSPKTQEPIPLTPAEKKQTMRELLAKFDTAFLVSHAHGAGHYHARPMAVAGKDDDGDLWFVTAIESPKVREIEADPKVLVTFQDGQRFMAMTGEAQVVRDRKKLDEVWSPTMKVWFPEGKDDPSVALLKVDVHEAEYWDNHGVAGLKYLFKAAKALVTGSRVETGDGRQHDRVKLD